MISAEEVAAIRPDTKLRRQTIIETLAQVEEGREPKGWVETILDGPALCIEHWFAIKDAGLWNAEVRTGRRRGERVGIVRISRRARRKHAEILFSYEAARYYEKELPRDIPGKESKAAEDIDDLLLVAGVAMETGRTAA
ncbi:MAG TPA: hypothetical protein VF719_03950, partial [Abditibacteriaceae bacterium]